MRHVLLLTTIILMAVSGTAMSAGTRPSRSCQEASTVRQQMKQLHEILGVNFIYDSSLDLDIPYRGEPMKDLVAALQADEVRSCDLSECLSALFKDTGIVYEIRKNYIVLTKAGSKKKPKDYTILIEEQHDTIDESRITAYIDRRRNATQTGLKKIDGSRFRKGFAFLSSPDLIKEIRNLPGVSGGNELLSGMYVHGGDGTDNLFLLDGVPLYQVSHLAGLISSFNTEIIDELDFYKSGFPSRFGGKLSSVADITTRQGDMHDYHGSFNIGLLNGGLQFEGPIIPGKTSFNVAVRRSWFDVLTVPVNLIGNQTLPYGESGKIHYSMTDLNASVAHLFDQDSRLAFNFYMGADKVVYNWENLLVKYWEGERLTGNEGYGIDARWGNILSSLNWKKKFSDNLHFSTILYYVRNNTGVGMSYDAWDVSGGGSYHAVVDEHMSESNDSRLHDIGARAEVDWIPSDRHHLRAGSSLVGHLFRAQRDLLTHTDTEECYSGKELEVKEFHDTDAHVSAYDAAEFSIYAEDEMALAPWFKADIGLRYALFSEGDKTWHSVEPRAALRFQLFQHAALKMSYTEMSQFIHLLQAHYLDIPMSTWLPSTSLVPPMRSRQVAGGIYVDLPHNITFNVEGYWKTMDNLSEYCGIQSIYPDISVWEHELVLGKGRSYGVEAEVSWKSKNTSVSAYYTLSWAERFFEGIWHDWFPARNDNRHKFTINATHRFSKRFEMYMAWNYHSGDRMTIPTHLAGDEVCYTSPYNYKLPDYHRLDVGFNFRKTTKRGNESIWNLSLYNAYCRMNPMFSMFDRYQQDGEYVSELKVLSAIPIIPSFNYTLRF